MTRGIAFLLGLGLAAPAFAQCGSGGSCLEPHDTPGCVVVECCQQVCDADPLCCEVGWDTDCVQLAVDVCQGLTCPSPGGCLEPHFTPGCEDSVCCHWTCALDAFCCYAAWDSICVEMTERLCAAAPCQITIPASAIDEDEPCYKRLNDGCNMADNAAIAIGCGDVRTGQYSTGAPRDTDWYRFEVATPARYRIEMTAEFPGQLLLLRGPCLGPLEVVGEFYGDPCGASVIDLCLQPGSYSCVVSGGTPSYVFRNRFTCDEIDPDNPPDPGEPQPDPSPYGLHYVLRLDCAGCLLGDLDGNGSVGPADLAILLGAWGGGGVADLNGDGLVGPADLGLLLGAWTA